MFVHAFFRYFIVISIWLSNMLEIIVQFSYTFDFYLIDTGMVNKNRVNRSLKPVTQILHHENMPKSLVIGKSTKNW